MTYSVIFMLAWYYVLRHTKNMNKKHLFGPPKKMENDGTGNCELCGKELGAFKWREHEHTACSKAHVEELMRLELLDLEQDME